MYDCNTVLVKALVLRQAISALRGLSSHARVAALRTHAREMSHDVSFLAKKHFVKKVQRWAGGWAKKSRRFSSSINKGE